MASIGLGHFLLERLGETTNILPPLLLTIYRSIGVIKGLFCHNLDL